MEYYRDSITGELRKGPGRFLGRRTVGDSRFERACSWVGPRTHRLGFRLWEWWSWLAPSRTRV